MKEASKVASIGPDESSASLGFDDVEPITASNEEIAAAVAQADLPALLASLAVLTGKRELIAPELRPPLPPMSASIAAQGGMTPQMQALARERAIAALIAYREQGCPPLSAQPELLDEAMAFIAKDAGSDYGDLLRHELALPDDQGAPRWDAQTLAPQRDFQVAIIGAGLAGIAAGYRLSQAGIPFTIFEKKPEVGGVWWANSYPGCRLDTPNFAYSFSFAQKSDWPQQFSTQPEIQRYISDVADRTGVRSNIKFGVEVSQLRFDDADMNWRVHWQGQDGQAQETAFDLVITAVGQLDRPFIPEIKGLDVFSGVICHSAQWPADLDIRGKRVAVVGTGASAYQIAPTIVDDVAELTVVQRNPPWMLPTANYHEDIKPGMAWLLRHVPSYGRWFRFWQFWIAAEGRLPLVKVDKSWQHPVTISESNEALRQECLAHLREQLHDRPDLLEPMSPSYPPGAKRMLRDNGVWARALKQPHTRLVTAGIDHVEPNAIVFADGSRREVDVIVFATGFQASDYLMPMKVLGRNGRDLHQEWSGDARAYLGITVPGYPNLFMMAGPNTSVVVNGSAIFSMECAVGYTMSAIEYQLKHNIAALDCRSEVCDTYNQWVDEGNMNMAWGVAKTSSWYKNSSGRASQTWPYSLLEYWRITRALRAGDYEALRR